MKLILLALATLLIAGVLISGFHPAPATRILFDNPRYQVLEDPQSGLVCTIDKTGEHLPVCRPARQHDENSDYPPTYPYPDTEPTRPVPPSNPDIDNPDQ